MLFRFTSVLVHDVQGIVGERSMTKPVPWILPSIRCVKVHSAKATLRFW